MKRPSFQFYPADWQANSNLRRCTHEEKGIWMDVMCLLHDQEQYGVITWPLKEIALAIGCSLAKLKGLVTKGILKGIDSSAECEPLVYTPRSGRKDGEPVTLISGQAGPIWYSSRMVTDEHKRNTNGSSTRYKTGEDNPKKPPPDGSPCHRQGERQGDVQSERQGERQGVNKGERQGVEQGDGSTSSSSSSSKNKEEGITSRGISTVAVEVCNAVSALGIDGCDYENARLKALLAGGVTHQQIVEVATEFAGKGKPMSYVLATVSGRIKDQSAAKRQQKSSAERSWRDTPSGVEERGRQLGLSMRPGEQFSEFKARVIEADSIQGPVAA